MTHLFLWESTDELHWTLLLPGCHGVVHGCECGVIDLDFICSVLGFGFLCNKQATFREDAFQKKIKSFIYQISFKKPVTFASATKHTYTHIKSIQHIGQIIFTSLHVGQEITWSKNLDTVMPGIPDITYMYFFCLFCVNTFIMSNISCIFVIRFTTEHTNI